MNRIRFLFSKSLLSYLIEEFRLRYYFKYTLPKIREAELDGIKLDVSGIALKPRNRILRGLYETHEKNMCLEHLKPSDAVMEIGGAIGFIGLVCQKKIGIEKYVSIEANPRTLEILKRNYALNGCAPHAIHCALASNDGQIDLEVGSDFWDNSVIEGKSADGRKTMTVPAATFQTLFRSIPFRVNVLIIDIEGAEQFIDFAQLPEEIEKIIIEMHPQWTGIAKKYQLFADLFQRGFRVAAQEDETFVFLKDGFRRVPRLLNGESARLSEQEAAPRGREPQAAAAGGAR